MQLPGQSPTHPSSQLYNASGVVQKGQSSRVEASALPSSPTSPLHQHLHRRFQHQLARCGLQRVSGAITFTNGLRPPTQPSNFNGARNVLYSFYVSDGATYSVVVNLTPRSTSHPPWAASSRAPLSTSVCCHSKSRATPLG